MIIMGIDPGYATTGVGVVEKLGSKLKPLHVGVITTPAKMEFHKRLLQLSIELQSLISTYKPETIAIEELLFNTNKKTAMSVAQARGVVLLSGAQNQLDTVGYTPPQIKLAVCGYGRADKQQVQYMVMKLLNLTKKPSPDDAADALAVAICHSHCHRVKSLT